jgi:hypothetical protein
LFIAERHRQATFQAALAGEIFLCIIINIIMTVLCFFPSAPHFLWIPAAQRHRDVFQVRLSSLSALQANPSPLLASQS